MFSCNVSLILYGFHCYWFLALLYVIDETTAMETTQCCIPLFSRTLQAQGWNCCCALASFYFKNYCKLNNCCKLHCLPAVIYVFQKLRLNNVNYVLYDLATIYVQWCVSNLVTFKYVWDVWTMLLFYSEFTTWLVCPNQVAPELSVWVVEQRIYCNFKVSFTK